MSEEIETQGMALPQPISRKRVIGEFIASFVGAYFCVCLLNGAIETWSHNKEWSWEMLRPDKDKLYTMLTISIGWTLFRIVINHNALLKTLDSFINKIKPTISKDVGDMICNTGATALRETLIEAVVSEGRKSAPPKIAFHGYALEFLHELRSFDEELFPAVAVLANNRVQTLKKTVENLKNDEAYYNKIEGKEQIEMSESFASKPAKKILFFDPKLYDDLEDNWSPAFKVFIDGIIKQSTAEKIQYLLFDDSNNKTPKMDSKLVAYVSRMKKVGFTVYAFPKSSLADVIENPNYKARLEIYDESVAVKIESRTTYKDADQEKHEISITLKAASRDHELKAFLSTLEKHKPRSAS